MDEITDDDFAQTQIKAYLRKLTLLSPVAIRESYMSFMGSRSSEILV